MAETEANSPLIDASVAATVSSVVTTAPQAKTKKQTPDAGGFIWGVGRRKSSVARVRIKPGSGKILVNKKELKDYFRLSQDQETAITPLVVCDAKDRFDVFINVSGGGTTGQAGASLLGIARALSNFDESFNATLRAENLMTRDGRMKERKKPGQRGARRRFQFSKR